MIESNNDLPANSLDVDDNVPLGSEPNNALGATY
jgi:hypothetical protein